MNTSSTEKLTRHFCDLINQKGYILSTQRLLIIEALCKQSEVKDLELFWLNLHEEHDISWPTVYKSIVLFVKNGWLQKEGKGVQSAIYRLNIIQG